MLCESRGGRPGLPSLINLRFCGRKATLNKIKSGYSELLHTYQPSRTLRSSSVKLLKVPKTSLKSAGNRSFHFQTAKIWNSLPTNVRSSLSLSSLKKNLKHIFLKNASLLVRKTPFLHSLTVECMCGCRRGGVNNYGY